MELRFNDPDLKVKGLTVRFLRDGKIVVKLGEDNFHYTLHPGHFSGKVDLHKTHERPSNNDPSSHETLAAFPKADIEAWLREIGPHLLAEFWSLWRPLRLGWMIRRRLAIGPRLLADVEFKAVSKMSVKEGPAHCIEPLVSWIKPPEFYEDVLQHPNAAYLLVDCMRHSLSPYGVMVTYRGRLGRVQMKWTKVRDVRRWAAKWESVLIATWGRFFQKSAT